MWSGVHDINSFIYCINISVLLENAPLGKFWRILGPVQHIFHVLTTEVISDVISYFFTVIVQAVKNDVNRFGPR